MRRIVGYMGGQAGWIALSMSAKLLAAVGELLIPFVLEHIIDRVAPGGSMGTAALWGMVMVLLALAVLAARFQDYDMSVRLLSSIITSRSANSRIKDKARDMKDQVMLDMKKKQQQQG